MNQEIDNLMKKFDADEIKILIAELKLFLEQAVADKDERLRDNYALKIALLRKELKTLDEDKVKI